MTEAKEEQRQDEKRDEIDVNNSEAAQLGRGQASVAAMDMPHSAL